MHYIACMDQTQTSAAIFFHLDQGISNLKIRLLTVNFYAIDNTQDQKMREKLNSFH